MDSDQSDKTYRILSLDGGGIFCLNQAKILEDLFRNSDGSVKSGHQILDEFDMVIGCSGGAIVTAALAADFNPTEIAELFLQQSNRQWLFSFLPWYKRYWRMLLFNKVGPRFSTEKKLEFLQWVLNQKGQHDWANEKVEGLGNQIPRSNGKGPTSFIFVTYDYDRDRTRLIRSNPGSSAANFPHSRGGRTLAEAVHASSTAPVIHFDSPADFSPSSDVPTAHSLLNSRRYWDGAMTGHNNPILLGIVEALANGVKRQNIRVLSLGAKSVYRPEFNPSFETESDLLLRQPSSLGFFAKLIKASSSIVADPPDTSLYISHVMLSDNLPGEPYAGNIVRMAPIVQPFVDVSGPSPRWIAPGTAKDSQNLQRFERLVSADIADTDQQATNDIKNMVEAYLEDNWNNQHIRASGYYSFREKLSDTEYQKIKAAGQINPDIGHLRYGEARHALKQWCPSIR